MLLFNRKAASIFFLFLPGKIRVKTGQKAVVHKLQLKSSFPKKNLMRINARRSGIVYRKGKRVEGKGEERRRVRGWRIRNVESENMEEQK